MKFEILGIVKGNRRRVSEGVKEMNRRAIESHENAPWNRYRVRVLNENDSEDWPEEWPEEWPEDYQ